MNLDKKADHVVRATRLGNAYKIDKKKLRIILMLLAKWHTIGLLQPDREQLAASLGRAIDALLPPQAGSVEGEGDPCTTAP